MKISGITRRFRDCARNDPAQELLLQKSRQRGAGHRSSSVAALLLTVLVTRPVGLSAQATANNLDAGLAWAELMGAVSRAEMELMLERMELPVGEPLELADNGEVRTPAYRFNGRDLQLNYPVGEDLVVRIYDHAGKINLNRINRQDMQVLITHCSAGSTPTRNRSRSCSWPGPTGPT